MSAAELDDARAALLRADWQGAHDAAMRAPDVDPRGAAERLELLADAAWWLGVLDDCIEHREAAYRAY